LNSFLRNTASNGGAALQVLVADENFGATYGGVDGTENSFGTGEFGIDKTITHNGEQ